MNEDNARQIDRLRRLEPYQRIRIGFELHDFARSRIAAEIKRNNPGISEKKLLDKLNDRFIR